MVLMVNEAVDTPNGRQNVLTPIVYLAQNSTSNVAGSGATITAATGLTAITSGDITNNGGMVSGGNTVIQAGGNLTNNGVMAGGTAAGDVAIFTAGGNVTANGGSFSGGTTTVAAIAGNVTLNAVVANDKNAQGLAQTTNQVSSVTGTGNVQIYAGQNIATQGASIAADGTIAIQAGNNITLGAVANSNTTMSVIGIHNGTQMVTTVAQTVVGTGVSGAGGVSIEAGTVNPDGQLVINAGNIASTNGGVQLLAAGGVTLGTANQQTVTTTTTQTHHCGLFSCSGSSSTDVNTANQAIGTTITAGTVNATTGAISGTSANTVLIAGELPGAGGALTVGNATGAVKITGANINANGAATVMGSTVNIAGAINTDVDVYSSTSHSGGLLSSSTTKVNSTSNTQSISGTTLTGDTVNIAAGGDINILASNVVGSNGVSVTSAGGNVTVGGITTTDTSSQTVTTKKSGLSLSFSGGGVSLFAGVAKTSDTSTSNSTTFNGSSIAALNGNLDISAANALTVTGSQILANTGTAAGSVPGTINLTGQSVTINNGLSTGATTNAQKQSSVGVTFTLGSTTLAAASTAVNMAQTAASTPNARVAATATLAGGLAAYNTVTDVGKILSGSTSLFDSASLSIGFTKSQSTSATTSQTVVGSQISGGNVNIQAAGAGANSAIAVTGSSVSASNNLNVNAAGAITFNAAAANSTQSAQNSSSGASLGLSLNSQGLSVTGSYNQGNGNSSGSSTTYTASTLSAGGTASVNSGGALTMNGAVLSGNTVDVSAKSLDITSTQDTSTFHSANQNVGLNLSYNIMTGQVSGAVNAGFGNANDNYKSVTTESGIVAGNGGYNINVAGNTNLTGAVISSTAPASANSLTTGTLTASSLANSEAYSDNQTSLGVGLTIPGGLSQVTQGANGQATSNGSGTPLPGVKIAGLGTVSATPPVAMSASGNQASTTQSAISPGTITITSGNAASQATAAALQANITSNSGVLTQQWTPALQAQISQGFAATTALVQQAGTFLADQAAQNTSANSTIKQYAEIDPATGQPATDANGNYILNPALNLTPNQQISANDALQEAQTTADNTATWGAGGTGNLVLTAITGAAGSNVTGSLSGLVQSAAVTTLQGLGTQAVKQIVSNLETQQTNPDGSVTLIPNDTSETTRTLLQGLVGCAGSAASGSGSCSAGAMGAAASVVLNDLIAQATNSKSGNPALDAQGNPISQSQQLATENLVSTLVGGIASAAGLNANAATTAAQVETANNSVNNTRVIISGASPLNGSQLAVVNPIFRKAYNALSSDSLATGPNAMTPDQQLAYAINCSSQPASVCNLNNLDPALLAVFTTWQQATDPTAVQASQATLSTVTRLSPGESSNAELSLAADLISQCGSGSSATCKQGAAIQAAVQYSQSTGTALPPLMTAFQANIASEEWSSTYNQQGNTLSAAQITQIQSQYQNLLANVTTAASNPNLTQQERNALLGAGMSLYQNATLVGAVDVSQPPPPIYMAAAIGSQIFGGSRPILTGGGAPTMGSAGAVADEAAATPTVTGGGNISAADGAAGATAPSNMSLADAQAYASNRVAELQTQLPPGSQGRVTMGVGIVTDANGNQITVISTSEPNGYLRPGVTTNPSEVVISGTGHAETDILNWASQNGYTVQTVAASRPICSNCASSLQNSNVPPATPLKGP